MNATDLADYLVERGVTFRDAHESGRQDRAILHGPRVSGSKSCL